MKLTLILKIYIMSLVIYSPPILGIGWLVDEMDIAIIVSLSINALLVTVYFLKQVIIRDNSLKYITGLEETYSLKVISNWLNKTTPFIYSRFSGQLYIIGENRLELQKYRKRILPAIKCNTISVYSGFALEIDINKYEKDLMALARRIDIQ